MAQNKAAVGGGKVGLGKQELLGVVSAAADKM